MPLGYFFLGIVSCLKFSDRPIRAMDNCVGTFGDKAKGVERDHFYGFGLSGVGGDGEGDGDGDGDGEGDGEGAVGSLERGKNSNFGEKKPPMKNTFKIPKVVLN